MKQIGYLANYEQVCDMVHTAGCYKAIFELGVTSTKKLFIASPPPRLDVIYS
jgi:hypothetical protein